MNGLDLKENEFKEKLFYNHKYHDAILMSILEDEYREKYNK
ncbi:hypothetical protein [Clostridium sp. Marseille-Q7071]